MLCPWTAWQPWAGWFWSWLAAVAQQVGGKGGVELVAQPVALAPHSAAEQFPTPRMDCWVMWQGVPHQQCPVKPWGGLAHKGTSALQSASQAAVAQCAAVSWWWWCHPPLPARPPLPALPPQLPQHPRLSPLLAAVHCFALTQHFALLFLITKRVILQCLTRIRCVY